MGIELTRILKNGMKVVTYTKKGHLNCDKLTTTFTTVFDSNGKKILEREKGVFRDWSSDSTLMRLPFNSHGTLRMDEIHYLLDLNVQKALADINSSCNRVGMTKCTQRFNTGDFTVIDGSITDLAGGLDILKRKLFIPRNILLNPEKSKNVLHQIQTTGLNV